MSAIGSVMVMFCVDLSWRGSRTGPATKRWLLPGGLGHAGQLAAVGHVTDADTAEAELAVDRLRPTAALAAGVGADRELRLLGRLQFQGVLRHGSVLLEREAEVLEQGPALVVCVGGGDDGDVHAPDAVDPVLVDLVEHRLLGQTERVVAVPV